MLIPIGHENMSARRWPRITAFQKSNSRTWDMIKDPNHKIIDGWEAKIRLVQNPDTLQAEMDSLETEYAETAGNSVLQQYAFTPANPRPLNYVTSMFLHGGWMHLIFNMWFLWLAGFVLEDNWGRI